MTAAPRAYSPEEVAGTIPGLTAWTIREYVRRGRIGALRIGGRRRIALTEGHVAELLALLEERPAVEQPRPAPARRAPAARQGQGAAPTVELRARPPRRTRRAASDDT